MSAYFGEENQAESKRISSQISGISFGIGIASQLLIGCLADRIPIVLTFAIAFVPRVIGLLLMGFVQEPGTGLFYFSMILAASSNVAADMSVGVYFMKVINPETRGALSGLNNIVSSLSVTFLSGFGGWSFDYIGTYSPFFTVAVLNSVFILVIVILALLGRLKT